MGLVKSKQPPVTGSEVERRHLQRTLEELRQLLQQGEAAERRWAARDLASCGEAAVEGLIRALPAETVLVVREAILDALLTIGGRGVIEGLIPLLRSDDAALRNGVIEVLQGMPDDIAPYMAQILADEDSDVRIFAIDILQMLSHRSGPQWLLEVIERESHVNVLAAAIDRLAEVGTPEMIPALERLRQQWQQQPFISFAIKAAIQRINGA
ncbi:HEAT repeat domain-containing protein [Ectothiorhodospiraceae bacterium BW-2]|nr:HEAT repeat domain-containing protein [Ectothiorhodospiraceae bacterium BW-2]